MEWGDTEPGGAKMGSGGPYRKKPRSYLTDYKACIDYMSENGINGLIIWGFVRDSHGGVAASQELCRYAADRGVQVLPGVGTSGYSGYVFEGKHKYNAQTWIKQHPDLQAIGKKGKFRNIPCPSKKANQEWLDDGAKWLFENFSIGGVNLEMGDFFVCHCDDCKKVRSAIKSDEPDYYKDMAISHRVTLMTMRKLAPDAWLSYATYTGFNKFMMTNPPKFIEMIPSDAICQWTVTRMLGKARFDVIEEEKWPANLKPMTKHSIGYIHWGCKSTRDEHDFYVKGMLIAAEKSHQAGLEGLGIYGELPISRPNMRINYLAFREFCFHPDLSLQEFTAKRLAPLYGKDFTDELWQIIELAGNKKTRKSGDNVNKALIIAQSVLEKAPPQEREQWQAMVFYLQSFSVKVN